MKRNNILHYTLELIVILGFLVLGITVMTYIFQGVPMDHVFIGSIVFADGVISFTDYFTWKLSTRIKSVQTAVAAIAMVALGAIFIFIDMDPTLFCVLFGAFSIAFSIVRIITAALNLTRQPLLNGIKIIISITEIVFSILLIIRTMNSLHAHMVFLGIALLVEAFILLVEFMVHRYQRI